MCHASNAVNIHFSHLKWKEDALGVYFAQMKNDQTGERPRDPRHVYANPLDPSICPILAVGLYLICFPNILEVSDLFPGGSQYECFRHNLNSLLKKPDVAADLVARGMNPEDLGTHSIRKGIATSHNMDPRVDPKIESIYVHLSIRSDPIQINEMDALHTRNISAFCPREAIISAFLQWISAFSNLTHSFNLNVTRLL
jgi:hypothetical protein